MVDKECSKCGELKPLELFQKGRAQCKPCRDAYHAEYRKKNKEKINAGMKAYYESNQAEIKRKHKEYRENNKDKISKSNKEWRSKDSSKEYSRAYKREWQRERLAKDPAFKLRRNVSRLINFKINKNSKSSFKYLPYTVQELKAHLESQFEDWMTWDNWGKYRVDSWNDNDKSTWTWQVDHIICQADLPYDSMEHPNFKKCWALSNLRPYSAKQNQKDGVSRIRHNRG